MLRALGSVLLAVLALSGGTAAAIEVDLHIVLAVDVSRSIDDDEYALQRRGYAEAFQHAAVLEAIQANPHRAIAVMLVEWAGVEFQKVQVPWTVVSDHESGHLFAELLLAQPRSFYGWTSVSGAIDYSVRQFATSPHSSAKKIVDISGDGVNNSGRTTIDARDDAVKQGITINGLVILNDAPTPGSYFRMPQPPLDQWYRDNVVGGPGAFVIAIDDFDSFAYAIRNKLLKEIASNPDGVTLADARVLYPER